MHRLNRNNVLHTSTLVLRTNFFFHLDKYACLYASIGSGVCRLTPQNSYYLGSTSCGTGSALEVV